ncbi:MAG: hypothetical protein PX481_03435 [Microcystis sp. M53603_WE2]|uniref:hypothetical protein n=1 Tax=Microcystis sp. M53603_WE2 TaxID=3030678 RepID=UPI00258706F3|nr:hypothetical protein [Microcystis sp. M53603_WE2]MDJ0537754.1 hypothetical protein [Microcystis sp. M53603_WE2]
MTTSKLVKPHTPPAPPMSGGLGGPHPAPKKNFLPQTLFNTVTSNSNLIADNLPTDN